MVGATLKVWVVTFCNVKISSVTIIIFTMIVSSRGVETP